MRWLSLLLLSLLALPIAAQPVTVRIDPARSTLSYTGTAPLHDWTGTTRSVTAQLQMDPANLGASRVEVSAPVRSFDSGNRTRDRRMADATEADRFPRVRFVATSIEPASDWQRTASGWRGGWRVAGRLTFHGVTRPVTLRTAVVMENGAFAVTGSFPVSLTAYGVDRPGLLGARIGDTITIRIALGGSY